MSLQLLIGVAMILGAGAVALTSRRTGNVRAVAALRRGIPEIERIDPPAQTSSSRVASIARVSRRITPASLVGSLETRISAAGLTGAWTMDNVLAAKLTLGAVGLLLGLTRIGSAPGPLSLLLAIVLTGALWYIPDFLASNRADERRRRIQHDLPDTMDQLTIAVEAGLGFEAAVARVAKQGDGPLAEELRRTLQDIQLGVSRSDALDALGSRTDVTDLRRFVAATRQAERYGLPIASVLRTQAEELRDRRAQRAEEHAMKIPVKVLFPLVFCILPTLFVVILGPGVIRFMQTNPLGG